MSIALSSATNNIGLFVNLSEINTSDILSLSSFLIMLIKSLILLFFLFVLSFFLFSLRFAKSTFPLVIDLNRLLLDVIPA